MDHQAFAEILGNYGEFVGAVAVVATLAYLAVQVRYSRVATEANTAAIRSSVARFNTETYIAMGSVNYSQRESAEVLYQGLSDPSDLDEVDTLRFMSSMNGVFRYIDTSYLQREAGELDEELWRSLEGQLRLLAATLGARKYWSLRSHWYSGPFADYFSSIIDATEADEDVLLYRRTIHTDEPPPT